MSHGQNPYQVVIRPVNKTVGIEPEYVPPRLCFVAGPAKRCRRNLFDGVVQIREKSFFSRGALRQVPVPGLLDLSGRLRVEDEALGVTATVHEPVPELFPGNPPHHSGFQLSGSALDLYSPGIFLIGLDRFQAVEQPRRHLRAVLFIQCQSLANDLFDWSLHAFTLT